MLYRLLHWLSGIALRWYYRDVRVVGRERIPRQGPLLVAVNHPNALVDALVAGRVVPRPLLFTAKATLFDHPLLGRFLPAAGVIPLRRVKDELASARANGAAPPERNESAFASILDALAGGGAVLIFPEGISGAEPEIAPLKTGIARLALQARDERGIRGLQIVPIGLTFEQKFTPRSRVLAQVGDPIAVDDFIVGPNEDPVPALLALVNTRLRAVTLNFSTEQEADEVLGVSEVLVGVFDDMRPLGAPDAPLDDVLAIARRVDAARRAMAARGQGADSARVQRFLQRLTAFRTDIEQRGLAVNDIPMDTGVRPGIWFLIREGLILAITGPLAWWGRLAHWLPLRLARRIALRPGDTPDQPAMRTIVAGLALVIITYVVIGVVAWRIAGGWVALAVVLSLPIAATWDFRLRDRMSRALQRTRAYLRFRDDPRLRRKLLKEMAWLREESIALEDAAAEVLRLTGDHTAAPRPSNSTAAGDTKAALA